MLLLNFLSVSMMAAFDKQKSWIKLYENKSSKLFIRPTFSCQNVIKRFYYHSRTVSHGRWGNRTSERACQVGGFSTIRVFYIVCKQSCWWVKVLIFFLKLQWKSDECFWQQKMKNEPVSEWSQTRLRAGLRVSGMINKFIYKQQFYF